MKENRIYIVIIASKRLMKRSMFKLSKIDMTIKTDYLTVAAGVSFVAVITVTDEISLVTNAGITVHRLRRLTILLY